MVFSIGIRICLEKGKCTEADVIDLEYWSDDYVDSEPDSKTQPKSKKQMNNKANAQRWGIKKLRNRIVKAHTIVGNGNANLLIRSFPRRNRPIQSFHGNLTWPYGPSWSGFHEPR